HVDILKAELSWLIQHSGDVPLSAKHFATLFKLHNQLALFCTQRPHKNVQREAVPEITVAGSIVGQINDSQIDVFRGVWCACVRLRASHNQSKQQCEKITDGHDQ